MLDLAPFRIPLNRRLQTFAVSHFVFAFLFLAPSCVILFIYLFFFTSFWPLVAAYLVFLFLDRNTPENGGRRSEWVRNWKLWENMSNYFPTRINNLEIFIQLYKTEELDPQRNYIFAIHPHGVLCIGAFTHFCTNGSGFNSLFPGFKSFLTMLPFWFRVPIHRDYIMSGGLIPSTKKSVVNILNSPRGGKICCIIPGGAPESLNARPGDVRIILKERYGFIKLAMTNGIPLVPVFSFGDHALWEQQENPPGSWLRFFQDHSQKWFTFALPLFHARGIFQYNWGLIPYRRSVHTVVGKPIEIEKNVNPSKEELFEMHEFYVGKLCELFDEHKSKYAPKGCRLVIE